MDDFSIEKVDFENRPGQIYVHYEAEILVEDRKQKVYGVMGRDMMDRLLVDDPIAVRAFRMIVKGQIR